jgi:hypothetical protein
MLDSDPFNGINPSLGFNAKFESEVGLQPLAVVELLRANKTEKVITFEGESEAETTRRHMLHSAIASYFNAGGTMSKLLETVQSFYLVFDKEDFPVTSPVFDFEPYQLTQYGFSTDGNCVLDFQVPGTEKSVRWEHGVYVDIKSEIDDES